MGSEVKASACNAGDLGSIPGSGRSPGEGNGHPLQYSCLENPMDGGPGGLQSTGSAKSRTQLSDFTFIKLPMVFFTELEKVISQFVWKYKKPRLAKTILRKKNGTGDIMCCDFRVYYIQSYSNPNSMIWPQRQTYCLDYYSFECSIP